MKADAKAPEKKVYKLSPLEELRLEVDLKASVTFQVVSGNAEIFGAEVAPRRDYTVSGQNIAIFTFQGCEIHLVGETREEYVSKEAPMPAYAVVHRNLEQRRLPGKKGPRVLIAGPVDSGKSTLSKILLNYAVQEGRTPLFIDLDIGQGAITVPGGIAVAMIDSAITVEEEFNAFLPLVHWFGHVSLQENVDLYNMLLKKVGNTVSRRMEQNPEISRSGFVVNTCGWIDGEGFDILLKSIELLEADTIVVLGQEVLFNKLKHRFESAGPEVLRVPRSEGVVLRSPEYRRRARGKHIREYFYGSGGNLSPHIRVIGFDDVTVYRIGREVSNHWLPIGEEQQSNPKTEACEVPTDQYSDLRHSVLGVSFASTHEEVVTSAVAGFVYIDSVNESARTFEILAPRPGEMPSMTLVVGTLQWLE